MDQWSVGDFHEFPVEVEVTTAELLPAAVRYRAFTDEKPIPRSGPITSFSVNKRQRLDGVMSRSYYATVQPLIQKLRDPLEIAGRQFLTFQWLSMPHSPEEIFRRFELDRRIGAPPTVAAVNLAIKQITASIRGSKNNDRLLDFAEDYIVSICATVKSSSRALPISPSGSGMGSTTAASISNSSNNTTNTAAAPTTTSGNGSSSSTTTATTTSSMNPSGNGGALLPAPGSPASVSPPSSPTTLSASDTPLMLSTLLLLIQGLSSDPIRIARLVFSLLHLLPTGPSVTNPAKLIPTSEWNTMATGIARRCLDEPRPLDEDYIDIFQRVVYVLKDRGQLDMHISIAYAQCLLEAEGQLDTAVRIVRSEILYPASSIGGDASTPSGSNASSAPSSPAAGSCASGGIDTRGSASNATSVAGVVDPESSKPAPLKAFSSGTIHKLSALWSDLIANVCAMARGCGTGVWKNPPHVSSLPSAPATFRFLDDMVRFAKARELKIKPMVYTAILILCQMHGELVRMVALFALMETVSSVTAPAACLVAEALANSPSLRLIAEEKILCCDAAVFFVQHIERHRGRYLEAQPSGARVSTALPTRRNPRQSFHEQPGRPSYPHVQGKGNGSPTEDYVQRFIDAVSALCAGNSSRVGVAVDLISIAISASSSSSKGVGNATESAHLRGGVARGATAGAASLGSATTRASGSVAGKHAPIAAPTSGRSSSVSCVQPILALRDCLLAPSLRSTKSTSSSAGSSPLLATSASQTPPPSPLPAKGKEELHEAVGRLLAPYNQIALEHILSISHLQGDLIVTATSSSSSQTRSRTSGGLEVKPLTAARVVKPELRSSGGTSIHSSTSPSSSSADSGKQSLVASAARDAVHRHQPNESISFESYLRQFIAVTPQMYCIVMDRSAAVEVSRQPKYRTALQNMFRTYEKKTGARLVVPFSVILSPESKASLIYSASAETEESEVAPVSSVDSKSVSSTCGMVAEWLSAPNESWFHVVPLSIWAEQLIQRQQSATSSHAGGGVESSSSTSSNFTHSHARSVAENDIRDACALFEAIKKDVDHQRVSLLTHSSETATAAAARGIAPVILLAELMAKLGAAAV